MITCKWRSEFLSALQNNSIIYHSIEGNLLSFPKHNFIIHLVNTKNNFLPEDLIHIQDQHSINNIKLIHLWEDVWTSKPEQVLFRLMSLLGHNKRIHGRKTEVRKINKPEADEFLNANHLQGAVSSRYKFGLFYLNELLAVATFSSLRKMNHTENYKSLELIRFATKGGYSITGGLSKLIKHIERLVMPNDIMTYADRDWSAGESYFKIDFKNISILPPQYFNLDTNLKRKLQKDNIEFTCSNVFNTGSIKFILRF
ncbi:hypothetical protein [Pedobacter mendelii]|uniref:Uncharacterized protein n=1 Tax=Pedobacter mendelii TaxID=1908240 RepID=A0ABQ2BH27_9SPHI|nr:hypothetical protein [Pedobacter mendelii]GGI25902.1 hypothetical protein GCM10008119_19970 [Pedobacter mendelii]